MILCGSIMFSKFMGDLNIIFENKQKKIDTFSKLLKLEDQVIAFVIDYNEQETTQKMNVSDIQIMNQSIKIEFNYNYNQTLNDEFF